MAPKKKKLYEGKAKIIYEGPEPGTLIQYFKDDATAFNNKKHSKISGKGVLNNRISERLMKGLSGIGVPTHFLKSLNMREQLIRKVEIIPLEVIIRNVAAGSLAKRYGIEEGTRLPFPLIEFCYKKDELDDPVISEEMIFALELADPEEIEILKELSLRINDFLHGLFYSVNIRLIDFKIEFGRIYTEDAIEIVLADEISPDSCRLWDLETEEKLDKDRFRRDMGNVAEAYQEVARRLGVMPESKPKPKPKPKSTGTRKSAGTKKK